MRPEDDIRIVVGGESVSLLPTLRAAWCLCRRYDGFAPAIRGICDGTLGTYVDLIRDHYDHPAIESQVWDAGLAKLRDPLLRYLVACVAADRGGEQEQDGQPTEDEGDGEPIPFDAYFSHLYKIGTGWLGWTPNETWNATPREIIEAQRGRLDMLRAIFGGTDDKPQPALSLADKFRATFNTFGTKKVRRHTDA